MSVSLFHSFIKGQVSINLPGVKTISKRKCVQYNYREFQMHGITSGLPEVYWLQYLL